MAERRKKLHFIYKITHTKSGKYYIGMHSTFNIDDGYMGSGKKIKESVNKYGEDKHTKEIIQYVDSRKSLVTLEAELVTEEIVSDKLCLNMKNGGHGGFAGDGHKKKFLAAGQRKRKFNLKKKKVKKRIAARKAKVRKK
tara:strand:- start:8722 stop:9138 length:417 start_codon:yes stop_codon:yes gene_type:complete